ncbi:hypothetical protein [Alysiella crassa]|nr:hypothetical protein [Alysiella crassa]
MRTKIIESFKYFGKFSAHGAPPYDYFCRVQQGSLKTKFAIKIT